MSENIDEAMELANKYEKKHGGGWYFCMMAADLLRPILAERDALRVERDRMRELLETVQPYFPDPELAEYCRKHFSPYGHNAVEGLYIADFEDIRKALAASPSPDSAQEADVCEWSQEEEFSDTWGGSCGITWTLIDDTPGANGMRFCPKCGKRLVERIAEAGI